MQYNFTEEIVKWFQLEFPEYVLLMNNTTHHYDSVNLNPYHLEGSIWTHTLMALKVADIYDMPNVVKMAILLHDLGKCFTRKEDKPSKKVKFINHASVSFFLAGEILSRYSESMGISKCEFESTKRTILFLIANHALIFDHELNINSSKYMEKVKYFNTHTSYLLDVALCDSLGRYNNHPKGNNLNFDIYTELKSIVQITTQQLPGESKPVLTMLIGLPCSGKSTFIKNKKYLNNEDTVVLSRDSIVMELAGTNNYNEAWKLKGTCSEVDKELEKRFVNAVRTKNNIVLDKTNLVKKERNKWLSLAKNYTKNAILLYTDFDTIKSRRHDRNIKENKEVPLKVLENMMISFTFPFYDQFDDIEFIFSENNYVDNECGLCNNG